MKKNKKNSKNFYSIVKRPKNIKKFFLLKQKNQCFCYILTLRASLRHIISKNYEKKN